MLGKSGLGVSSPAPPHLTVRFSLGVEYCYLMHFKAGNFLYAFLL